MEAKSPEVNAEVENFDKCKLKKTTTKENRFIPTKKDIEDEKRENEKNKCEEVTKSCLP